MIEVIPQVISEISSIPTEGGLINKGHINFDEVINAFHEGNERRSKLQIHKGSMKGVSKSNLDKRWKTIALWLMKFFTCEGQYDIVLGPGM